MFLEVGMPVEQVANTVVPGMMQPVAGIAEPVEAVVPDIEQADRAAERPRFPVDTEHILAEEPLQWSS